MVSKRVFILTPSTGFGGLIRQVLEDAGGYQPFLFPHPKDALEQAQKDAVAMVILDAEMGAAFLPALVEKFHDLAPLSRLVIIPKEEDPNDPQLIALEADAILPSPFYLPDLVAVIEQFFGPLRLKDNPKRSTYGDVAAKLETPARQPATAPDWLEDVSQAAGYLARLSLESASRAALITKGQKVWAYAGELPKEAADELAAAVSEHAAINNETDLARFIHLSATGIDYMLYATGLGSDFTLALAFDAQMPFSQMRSQVNELAKALATASPQLLSKEQVLGSRAEHQPGMRMQAGEGNQTPGSIQRGMNPQDGRASTASPSQPIAPRAASATGALDLVYSYVLIPRLPKHRLEGDLAEKLAEWLPELCLAFAWRMERLAVQLDFVRWTLSMPPDVSPESAVQTLDSYLSEKIFDLFPRLARDNPSGQFWAPGYLIVSAVQPSPTQISEYIQTTRARQGVPR